MSCCIDWDDMWRSQQKAETYTDNAISDLREELMFKIHEAISAERNRIGAAVRNVVVNYHWYTGELRVDDLLDQIAAAVEG